MPVANSILRSFVAVVTGVGNVVDELGVQLTLLWLYESKRYDRLGRILEVVRNIPDRARVLGVRVVVVVELNVGRLAAFWGPPFSPAEYISDGGRTADGCIAKRVNSLRLTVSLAGQGRFGPVLWGRHSLFKRLSMIGAGQAVLKPGAPFPS